MVSMSTVLYILIMCELCNLNIIIEDYLPKQVMGHVLFIIMCIQRILLLMKALVKMTFHFADHLWCLYLALNKSDVRCVPCTLIVIIKSHIKIIFIF